MDEIQGAPLTRKSAPRIHVGSNMHPTEETPITTQMSASTAAVAAPKAMKAMKAMKSKKAPPEAGQIVDESDEDTVYRIWGECFSPFDHPPSPQNTPSLPSVLTPIG